MCPQHEPCFVREYIAPLHHAAKGPAVTCRIAWQERWPNHVILRSSIIYGPQSRMPVSRALFLQFVARQLAEETPTSFFNDEFRNPVFVDDIVSVVLRLLQPGTTQPGRWACSSSSKLLFRSLLSILFNLLCSSREASLEDGVMRLPIINGTARSSFASREVAGMISTSVHWSFAELKSGSILKAS